MTPEFSRKLPIERIGAAGYDITVEAGSTELAGLTARLQVPAVSALVCRFRLRPEAGGTITAEGWLDAVVTQICVVSLDEFAAPVSDHFVIHFVPAGSETAGSETGDIDPESDDEIAYRDGMIDLGEAAAEQLALVLDPWPRKPDAILPQEATDDPVSPFASLIRARPPS
jgi:hypothetical protein